MAKIPGAERTIPAAVPLLFVVVSCRSNEEHAPTAEQAPSAGTSGVALAPLLHVGEPDGGCTHTYLVLPYAQLTGVPQTWSAVHANQAAFSSCENKDVGVVVVAGVDTSRWFIYSKASDRIVGVRDFAGYSTTCWGDTSLSLCSLPGDEP